MSSHLAGQGVKLPSIQRLLESLGPEENGGAGVGDGGVWGGLGVGRPQVLAPLAVREPVPQPVVYRSVQGPLQLSLIHI